MRNYILVFFGCLLFHLAGTWSLPLIDRDEPRFAEAAREMRERADFIVPYFNNQFRFDKPPLTYWFQLASYRVFGENDFAARFPTAIAAALVAVILLAWGLFKANIEHRTSNIEHRTVFWWTFYISLAFAFLAKGPIGWTPLLTVAIAHRFHRQKHFAAHFKFVRGLLLMLVLICLWGIPALVRTQGEFFRVGIGKHVVERSVATMEGHGASSFWMYLALLPFYFLTVFASFFPWSVKLPALCKNLRAQRDGTDQFLLAGALIIFGIFTLVQTKLPHYTLPAFPLLALLVARRFESLRFARALPIAATAVYLAVALFLSPLLARFFPTYNLARDSRLSLKPEMEFGAIEFSEPSLVWYFRDKVRGFMTPVKRKDAGEFMSRSGSHFIVLPTASVAEIFPNIDPSWHSYRTKGFNIPKGRRVDLTMLLKPE